MMVDAADGERPRPTGQEQDGEGAQRRESELPERARHEDAPQARSVADEVPGQARARLVPAPPRPAQRRSGQGRDREQRGRGDEEREGPPGIEEQPPADKPGAEAQLAEGAKSSLGAPPHPPREEVRVRGEVGREVGEVRGVEEPERDGDEEQAAGEGQQPEGDGRQRRRAQQEGQARPPPSPRTIRPPADQDRDQQREQSLPADEQAGERRARQLGDEEGAVGAHRRDGQ